MNKTYNKNILVTSIVPAGYHYYLTRLVLIFTISKKCEILKKQYKLTFPNYFFDGNFTVQL